MGFSKFSLAVLVVIFLTFQTVLSQDFSAYSESSLNICGCSVFEQNIFISNSASYSRSIFIHYSGSAAGFTTIYPDVIKVDPHSTITVAEYVNSPCGANGNYDLSVDFKTDDGLDKSFAQNINVGACKNSEVSLSSLNYTGCRCNVFTYGLILKNTGKFSDNFAFDTSGIPSAYRVIVPSSAKLGVGQSQKINVIVYPGCDYLGGNFYFNVQAERSGFSYLTALPMNINSSCSGFGNYSAVPQRSQIVIILEDSLLFLPLVILLLAVLIFLIRRGRKNNDVEEKPRSYAWEKKFPKESKKTPVTEVKGNTAMVVDEERKFPIIWVGVAILVLIILIILVFVLIPKNLIHFGNFKLNQIAAPSTKSNFTMPPISVPSNYTVINTSGANMFFSNVFNFSKNQTQPASNSTSNLAYAKKLVSDYGLYALIGLVVLAVIIIVFEIISRRQKKSLGE